MQHITGWYEYLLPLLCLPITDDIYDVILAFIGELYPK